MFSVLRIKSIAVLILLGIVLLAGCQNMADLSADHYAGELPPQSENSP